MSKNIVVIGGGHGSSVVLSSLKDSDYNLSAVISVADQGGSTGRLRSEYNVSPPGDIRQCLVALADEKECQDLLNYRFKDGSLSGHNFGNLLLSAGQLVTGDMQSSIEMSKKMLGIKQGIFPVADQGTELILEQAGQEIRGDFHIVKEKLKPPFKLKVEPQISASSNVIGAISKADFIIIAPGNFYCSVIPQFMYGGVKEAIKASDAKLIMLSNLVNFVGHTDDFDVQDYLEELQRIVDIVPDVVIYNTKDISADILPPGVKPVGFARSQYVSKKIVGAELASEDVIEYDATDTVVTRSLVRHDKEKLAEAISQVIGSI